ncbi:MAG: glycoside hydrolase family protein, partial [Planctomycetota bacterium]
MCHFSPDGSGVWPVTDWLLDKVMVGSPSNGTYESKVYSDTSGLYLIYSEGLGDGDIHIMAQKLLDPDDVDYSFTARAILSPEGLRSEDRNPPGGMQIVEGPNIKHVVTPEGSKYVMFYAVGDFALENYKLGVAYSDVLVPSPGQQYSKVKSFDSSNVWGNTGPKNEVVYTLQTQISEWPNYYGDLFNGPGLGNLVDYLDRYYIIFHARNPGQTGSGDGRWTWICPASVDFSQPMHSWVVPNLPNPELIKNASFESNFGSGTEPTDWNKDFNCWGAYDGASVSGSWCLHPGDGGPPGGCYQDIVTLSGKWYEMSLWIQNFDGAAGTGNVKVLIGEPGSQNYVFENGTDKTKKFSLAGLLDMNFSTGIPWAQADFSFQATGP